MTHSRPGRFFVPACWCSDRDMRARIVLFASLLLGACGAARPATTSPSDERSEVTPEAPRPSTATELVELLAAIATGERAGSLDDHVDEAFAERLASSDDLAGLFSGYPDGCTPELEEGPGYGAVAIPPPMDEDEEEVARIEGIIAELQASTEVMATCTVAEEIDGEEVEQEMPLYAIAVRRGEDGVFRALAWRDFRNEGRGH